MLVGVHLAFAAMQRSACKRQSATRVLVRQELRDAGLDMGLRSGKVVNVWHMRLILLLPWYRGLFAEAQVSTQLLVCARERPDLSWKVRKYRVDLTWRSVVTAEQGFKSPRHSFSCALPEHLAIQEPPPNKHVCADPCFVGVISTRTLFTD